MASPPHNIGSDAEDGEISASEDETTVGKDDAQECSIASALPVGKSEEESCEDLSPQRKVFFPQGYIFPFISTPPFVFQITQFPFWLHCFHTKTHLVLFY